MSGRPAPAKPWERTRGPAAAATPGSAAEGLPKPWETPGASGGQTVTPLSTSTALAAQSNAGAAPNTAIQPARPWERTAGGAVAGPMGGYTPGYGATQYARPGYGGAMGGYGGYPSPGYGAVSPYGGGGYGGMAGYGGGGMTGYGGAGGMYGRPMYGGVGGMYGAGGGMYGAGGMSPYGGMGPGPMAGAWDPNDPNAPPAPPSAWQGMLAAISGVVHFFGRLSFLVDENAHAVHFFVSALLQLLDRFGSLYGELARFVLRLLGFKPKDKQQQQQQQPGGPAAFGSPAAQQRPPGAPWDSVWAAKNS